MMILSIIIPVYNEDRTVKKLIDLVIKIKLPTGWKSEIVVVDDASTDMTANLLKTFKGITIVTHKTNKGKGAAIRTGIRKANGKYCVIQDADLEYDPKDIVRLLDKAESIGAKVVYGTRLKSLKFKPFGPNATPMPIHYIGNKFLTFCTNLLFGSRLTDMETCYKLVDMKLMKSLSLRADRFDIEPEITGKLLKRGVEITELPISVKPRGYQEGKKIGWRDAFAALYTLLIIRFS